MSSIGDTVNTGAAAEARVGAGAGKGTGVGAGVAVVSVGVPAEVDGCAMLFKNSAFARRTVSLTLKGDPFGGDPSDAANKLRIRVRA